ncbi:hypothetical protein BVC80_9093g75 [Macleaya cordata]|uniref:Uncharacterized protein n=1 Tax=Macleaya cordata TaxID=56857 RepID=A0A200PX13_MACCD|nr:hypothetical protein BVC80_9093g75 [Macleaya cordata]
MDFTVQSPQLQGNAIMCTHFNGRPLEISLLPEDAIRIARDKERRNQWRSGSGSFEGTREI